MKKLKQLKAMLATEIEAREVYKEGFDAVKELEGLDKHKSDLEKGIKSLEKLHDKAEARVAAANDEATRLEEDYAAKAVEAQEAIASNIQASEKQIAKITEDARREVKDLEAKSRKLSKTIKEKEKAAGEAEAALAKATKELEDVRGRLKSI